MRENPSGFSKEKLVFLCAVIACAGLTYRFITSCPVPLVSGEPKSVGSAEPLSAPTHALGVKNESAYFHGTRKSPFFIDKEKPYPLPKDKGPSTSNGNSTDSGAEIAKSKGADPKELYAFSGVIVMNSQFYALLTGKKTAATLRVREGEIIAGGFQITKIEKQAIVLQHENGQMYVLKDTGS